MDIVQILAQQPDYKAARNYWKVLKNRLSKEGSQLVTNCNQLKLPAADGKKYLINVADAETLLGLIPHRQVTISHDCPTFIDKPCIGAMLDVSHRSYLGF